MTVFWSDPTKIHLALPPGDEMEDEYYNPPATTGHGFTVLGITGPGVAEIKAHNRNGIAGAIKQLATKTSIEPPRPAGSKPTNYDDATLSDVRPVVPARLAASPNLSRIIITYRPTGWVSAWNRKSFKGPRVLSPVTVDVYAVKFAPNRKVDYYQTSSAKWVLVKPGVPVVATVPVSPLTDATIFGRVVEGHVRKAFADVLRGVGRHPYNLAKASGDQGADVTWTEIAEMYAELARTTNDEFLAALANELATPG